MSLLLKTCPKFVGLLLLGTLLPACSPLATQNTAAIELPPILSDGVVFQRGLPLRLWGTAGPNENITAELSGRKASTRTDMSGHWHIELPAFERLSGNLSLRSDGGSHKIIQNPMLGQVWLCGGQSNMAMPLKKTDGAYLAQSIPNKLPPIHLFRTSTGNEQQTNNHWIPAEKHTALNFSALCYMVGRKLAESLNEPVGLIDTSIGGTRIEAWQPLNETSDFQVRNSLFDITRKKQPHYAFESIIRPLTPFSIKGLLWYQGEANALHNPNQYAEMFVQTVKAWRTSFQNPTLPIVFMQLPDYTRAKSPASWTALQSQQAEAQKNLPNSYMADSTGLNDDKLHSKSKLELANRLYKQIILFVY
jgi:sialate O-acetylesterase